MIAIYARQSVERQDSVSIEAQIAQCLKFVNGAYEVYQDAGYSGKDTCRPAFEQMIDRLKQGRISTVISYRLDRISRSLGDFAKLLELFEQYQVQYISATEQFDTSSPIGRAMIYIVMVFAQLERETIALRIEDNYKYRARQGLYMGGNTPYGYTSKKIIQDGKRISVLEVDPQQAAVLSRMVCLLLLGNSPPAIARLLNQEGILNRNNKPWTSLGVQRILRNSAPCTADRNIYGYLLDRGYRISDPIERFDGSCGMSILRKTKHKNQTTALAEQTVTVGMHSPILSSADYMQVQYLLDNAPTVSQKASATSFLSGLAYCKHCGSKMSLKVSSYQERSYRYFRCSGRADQACNNTTYIPVDLLEEQLTAALAAHLKDLPIRISSMDHDKDFLQSTTTLSLRMEALLEQIGSVDKTTDARIMAKVKKLKAQLDQEKSRLRNAADQGTTEPSAYLAELFTGFGQLALSEKSTLICAAVEQITADQDGEIEMIFRF